MTRQEALKLIGLIPESAFTRKLGWSATCNEGYAKSLKAAFPDFNWRIILDRSGQYSRWRLTIDDDDPREHYFNTLGGKCIHCGKSAREIARIDEVNGDDEFLAELQELCSALSKRPRG